MGRGMNSGRKTLTSRYWCKGTAIVTGNAGRKTSTDSECYGVTNAVTTG